MRLTPGDEAYEQDTLTEVKQLLTSSAPNLARWQKRVLDVRLEGTRPDTRLVVDYWDDYVNEKRTRAFALWTRNRHSGEIEPEDAPGSWAIIVRENIEVPPGVELEHPAADRDVGGRAQQDHVAVLVGDPEREDL